MAEVDARTARGAAAAPITAFAFGRLHSLAADQRLLAANGKLIDAFADVFASMSQASAVIDSPNRFVPDSAANQSLRREQDGNESLDASAASVRDDADESPALSQDGSLHAQVHQLESGEATDESGLAGAVDDAHELNGVQPEAALVAADASQARPVQPSSSSEATTEIGPTALVQDDAIRKQRDQEPSDLNRQSSGAENTSWSSREAVEQAGDRRAIAHDATDAAAKVDAQSKASEQAVIQPDPSDAESNHDRRRQSRRESGESNPVDAKSANLAQRGPAKPSLNPSSVAAEAIASTSDGLGSSSTTPASPPTSQSTATLNQIQSVAPALSVAETGTGSRAAIKGVGSTADVREVAQVTSRPASTTARPEKSASDVVARIKLIQRVSKAFQHLGSEGGSVRIRLAPAELGSVRVEMHVRDRQVRARVVADNEAAGQALREHLPDLRARLESYGLQVEQLEVETENGDRGFDAQQDADSRWQPPQQQRRSEPSFTSTSSQSTRADADAMAVVADSGTAILRSANRGVDVRL